MIPVLSKSVRLIAISVFFIALFIGCDEKEQDTSAGAAEAINASDNGLVKSVEGKEGRSISKYLTPRYLAIAEAESRGYEKDGLDSLIELYSRTMNFHIATVERQAIHPDPDIMSGAGPGAWSAGIRDVEAERSMFSLQCGDSLWAPAIALPESRIGEAQQVWFVVFAVDPRTLASPQSTAVVTYAPPGKETVRFTYIIKDFLSPEFIASIK